MDSSTRPAVTPSKSRLARTFVRVLHARTATGVTPVDGFHKLKSIKEGKPDPRGKQRKGSKSFNHVDEEEQQRIEAAAMEALLARVFASISCIKAAYAELQLAQAPYDADAIQCSDGKVVSELKIISELKQCFLKKQLGGFHKKVVVSSEIIEQKSVLKTYEIMRRKLESQLLLKESELTTAQEKLENCKKENRSMEKRLNASGPIPVPDNLHLSGLSPNHFIPVLRHAIRSIRAFVKLVVSEMLCFGWDLDAAANMVNKGVKYWKQDHKCFAIESFVCREMFDGFQNPKFSLPNDSHLPDQWNRKGFFFERFIELKSVKEKDYLAKKPGSTFGQFCRAMYLRLIHPKMELSFFGNLNQRDTVNSGQFPETKFFTAYAEMAKRIWILHCLAFSFETPAMIFQVKNGCRFSEVFMESVADEPFLEASNAASYPTVAFTVVPGFKLGKTVIQSQVYLSTS